MRYQSINKSNQINIIAALTSPHFESDLLRELILVQILNRISHNHAIAHMKHIIVTISNQSLFTICVNSCHATASISALFIFSSIHLEKTIHDFLIFHHTANAFILESSSIQILGIGNHLDIQRFSTILYISGYSTLVIGTASVKENIICL